MLSKNTKETAQIAKIFLNKLLKSKKEKRCALVVGLSGDLGAGKTVFAKSIAKHLGVKNKVFSPTFVIMKKYPIKLKGYNFFFHLDAYRLKNEKELINLGWGEIINNKNHLVFIEWPENVSKAIPSDARFVYISGGNENNHRNFKFK
ncbi:tRNA (adenosine(37)-N6)-threonylcarbamoyltransferase complex ATPase subunit type 1 TsaE [Candidatus Nomurabacteria bacterium RIFCSPHIGHO2_02_FULL_35_13]|uniref:tRNA threonylcarbamoyladenosine biosynthesis protein TsaE n=1 Tax=Candidatus Nomurabacteria bacterium RIFCSPHIGHO2_02_FULL_35_13 TaxID=1801748 RepID=A0A1F6VPI9_9BACT|nr:MAG: tRNA (adenosine(37)-N6)-threonylcarbamoyltransferase complex ATPase subunit type 1 TsaE [Candidatus Nomurabacteria bacterium RIFCSPHIGHO2_02_FULL_35_13]